MLKAARLSDSQIHAEVLEELKWDMHINETEVGIEVDNGVVTLTGTVDSYAKKVAALEAAQRVRGVLDVVNDVDVRTVASSGHSDTEIAHAVRRALEWDALIPHENIHTTVASGWVNLNGTVPVLSDRLTVEQIVHRLAGVRGVSNLLTVMDSANPSQGDIRQTIEQALERRAEREARDIQVEVSGHNVKLTGTVHSLGDQRAIVNAAAHARGVSHIEQKISVNPYN